MEILICEDAPEFIRDNPEHGVKYLNYNSFKQVYKDGVNTNRCFIAIENDEILGELGFAHYQLNGHYSMSTISVSPKHKNKGVAKFLIDSLLNYCVENNILTISTSYWTLTGFKYVKPYLEQKCIECGVELISRELGDCDWDNGEADEFYKLRNEDKMKNPRLYP